MSYRFLEHATDAIVELEADTLQDAFEIAGNAVIDTTLNMNYVEEKEEREFIAQGKDLEYLLFSWLEEVIYVLITEGFAIKRLIPVISKDQDYKITCRVFGEPINLSKHKFKVEIKAPTFHDMEIKIDDDDNKVYMRFLLDL